MHQSTAESYQKYGGELLEVRRRVGKGWSENCSDAVGEFGWSDEKVPDPLGDFGRPTWAIRSTDWGCLGRPTRAFRSTDSATSVDRQRHFGQPTLPTRSTEFAYSQASRQYRPRVRSIPRCAWFNKAVSAHPSTGPFGLRFRPFLIRRLAQFAAVSPSSPPPQPPSRPRQPLQGQVRETAERLHIV